MREGARGGVKAASKVPELANDLKKWLGKDYRVIINKAGDTVLLSKDGLKKIRFDLSRPHPHVNPHSHIEQFINGKWVKGKHNGVPQLYPRDVPKH